MFQQVFDPDNLFWRLMARAVDFVGLGLFWALLCLPVVTILPATSALYYTVVKVFRHGEEDGFRLLWRAFHRDLRRGIRAELLCLPVLLVLAWGYTVMLANRASALGSVMYVMYYFLLSVPVGVLCWLVPLLGRFEGELKQSFRTAFLLAMGHFPTTLILVLLHLQLLVWTLNHWWPLFFTPVLAHLLASLFQEKIFIKYLDGEERRIFDQQYPE